MDDDTFRELAGLAYRTAYRITGSRSDAEDVAQETMAKAIVRWRTVESHAHPWVGRVAANGAIGMLRKRRVLATLATRAVGDPGEAVVDRLDLQRTLLELPRRQREVLVLRYLLDLPESAVAEELGVSVGTVKTHAHRALASLRPPTVHPSESTQEVPP